MLANGTKLRYKEKDAASAEYTDLPGLKEIPEMGIEGDKADNTCLTDPHKMYEKGIGDLPELSYKFKYDNTKEDSPYRVMRKYADSDKVLSFEEILKDGTTTTYDAQVSVKRTGGGVNGVIEFDLTMFVQSELKIADPGESPQAATTSQKIVADQKTTK